MDDIGSSNDDMSTGLSFRRPSRAERSVDDPIREMEGMLVDEYGRFASFYSSTFSISWHLNICICTLFSTCKAVYQFLLL